MMTYEQFKKRSLSIGSHERSAGTCAMELLSLLVGNRKTDEPICVSFNLQRFIYVLNDHLPDAQRQELKPFIPRMINTAYDPLEVAVERDYKIKKVRERYFYNLDNLSFHWEAIKKELDAILSIGEENRQCFAFKQEKD